MLVLTGGSNLGDVALVRLNSALSLLYIFIISILLLLFIFLTHCCFQ